MKHGNPHIELSTWNMVGGIHTLAEKGNEVGNPHSECAPGQGIRTLFYMLCYVDEVVNTQYRKGRERGGWGGAKGKKYCRPQALGPVGRRGWQAKHKVVVAGGGGALCPNHPSSFVYCPPKLYLGNGAWPEGNRADLKASCPNLYALRGHI
jgi:hypothetical protein